jgi:hypothetical protein
MTLHPAIRSVVEIETPTSVSNEIGHTDLNDVPPEDQVNAISLLLALGTQREGMPLVQQQQRLWSASWENASNGKMRSKC